MPLAACRSAPQTLAPRTIAEISPSSGAVSAKLVPDPSAPEVQLAPGEEYVAPQLMPGNANPKYPDRLLPLRLQPHVVFIRVTFDEYSRVLDIAPSPVGASTNDEYQPEFAAAVRDAVQTWRCWPARIRKFREGPGFRILAAERVLKTFFDMSFSFEVVNGQPVVKRGS